MQSVKFRHICATLKTATNVVALENKVQTKYKVQIKNFSS